MKILLNCYVVTIILGASLAFFNPLQLLAEQVEEPAPEEIPQLKPDSAKLAEPKQQHTAPRQQLKGSVQHSEVIKPQGQPSQTNAKENGQLAGSTVHGKLDGRVGQGKFKLKGQQLNGGLNQTDESGLGIIGLKFAIYFGRAPMIYQVFPDTPAYTAGLKTRDIILAVDGIPTFGLSKNEVYNMIVGKPGTDVTISYSHNHNYQTRTLTRMDVNDIPDPRVRRDYLSM